MNKLEGIRQSIDRIMEQPIGPQRDELIDIALFVLEEYVKEGRITESERDELVERMDVEPPKSPLVQLTSGRPPKNQKRYECDCCGACCQGHLIVEVYDIDVMREPNLISAARPLRDNQTYDTLMEDFANGKCLTIALGESCKYLTEGFKCAVYPTRPNACVAMEAGDDQCQYARAAAGLPPLEPK